MSCETADPGTDTDTDTDTGLGIVINGKGRIKQRRVIGSDQFRQSLHLRVLQKLHRFLRLK